MSLWDIVKDKITALLAKLHISGLSTVWGWIVKGVAALTNSTKTVIATPMTYPLVGAVFVGAWILGHHAGTAGKAYFRDRVAALAANIETLENDRDAALRRARTAEAKVAELSAPKPEPAAAPAAPESRPRQAPRRVSNPAPKADSFWQFKF